MNLLFAHVNVHDRSRSLQFSIPTKLLLFFVVVHGTNDAGVYVFAPTVGNYMLCEIFIGKQSRNLPARGRIVRALTE